jgi:hypothetical protein
MSMGVCLWWIRKDFAGRNWTQAGCLCSLSVPALELLGETEEFFSVAFQCSVGPTTGADIAGYLNDLLRVGEVEDYPNALNGLPWTPGRPWRRDIASRCHALRAAYGRLSRSTRLVLILGIRAGEVAFARDQLRVMLV